MPRAQPGCSPETDLDDGRRVNPLEATLRHIGADLAGLGVGQALVGGLAVSVRTEPRFTRDVDLALAVEDDSSAEAVIRSLLERGYHSVAAVEHEATGRLATVRLTSPVGEGAVVDLLLASSGIEHEIVAQAEQIEVLPGLTAPVATTGHLITLKLLARDDLARPQDLGDLRALLSAARREDLESARASLELVTTRGYHRGRDLSAALLELLGEGRGSSG